MPDKWVEIKTSSGDPISAGNMILTPRSQSLIVRLPGLMGGLIWNRPLAVQVRRGEESLTTLPVVDHTRLYQLTLLGLGLLGAAILGRLIKP